MSTAGLTLKQFSYENKAFWRNPAAAFFTFVFPLMFLVLFNGIFGHSQFFVPAIAAFSVVTACFTNIAMGVTIARDQGVLKRMRGTPLPAVSYLLGRVLHAIFIAVILVMIVTAAGVLFYDVDFPESPARLALTLAVGAATFCCLGLAITAAIPNEEAAPAVVNAAVLPLSFVSDVFIDSEGAPGWMQTLGNIFPIKHFAQSMLASFDPDFREWSETHLIVMGVWGLAGLLIALKFFSWEPRR